MRLSTLVVITNADGAFTAQPVGPETAKFYVGLWKICVGQEKPEAEDGLGKDIQDSVGNDFLVQISDPTTIGDTPDAIGKGQSKDLQSYNME